VTARSGSPHIKIFEEERELTVFLLVDISGSTLYGTKGQYKKDLIAELSAVLSFSAITNNDKVGAILFADDVLKYLPPKKGKQSILRIIREMLNQEPQGQATNLGKALEYLNNVQKKKAIVFLLSDFISEEYELPLRIAAKRHDLIGLHIYDHSELDLPNVGLIEVTNPESGETTVLDTSNKTTTEGIKSYFQKYNDLFKKTFLKYGADIISIKTDEDYVKPLYQFFKRRKG
jgi:uncharacterized protein (DUF58 family)